jgi:hypothetical protein
MAESQDDMVLFADTLDASLTGYWGPDDLDRRRVWALRLADAAAHLPDPDARLQAHLWALTLAWETLDLTRTHREMRALEQLAEESPRARFFAASRRLALDLFRNRTDTLPALYAVAEAASRETLIPDSFGVLHCRPATPPSSPATRGLALPKLKCLGRMPPNKVSPRSARNPQ